MWKGFESAATTHCLQHLEFFLVWSLKVSNYVLLAVFSPSLELVEDHVSSKSLTPASFSHFSLMCKVFLFLALIKASYDLEIIFFKVNLKAAFRIEQKFNLVRDKSLNWNRNLL